MQIDKLKNERLVVQEQSRQISNDNTALADAVNEEKKIIEDFEAEIEKLRGINFRRNDDNLDLLAQTEALENHIRMLYDQNSLIESEINKFISEDDELAHRLERQRSNSPSNHLRHKIGD